MSYTAMIDRTEAGPLIPEDVSNEIIKEATEKSFVLSAFKRKQMSRKQQRLPIFDRKPIAYFVNGDTGLKQSSDVRWDNVYLNAEEIAVIVPVPDLLVEDAALRHLDGTAPRGHRGDRRQGGRGGVLRGGPAHAWPTGILQGATAASQVVTGGSSALDVFGDMNAAMMMLEDDGYDPMAWFARLQMRGILRNTRDANKGFLYPAAGPANTGGQSVGWKGEVWNTPLFVSKMGYAGFAAGAANAAAFVLDTDNFICAVRDDINMKVFTEGVISNDAGAVVLNLMQQDAKALRVTFRMAWAMTNPVTRMQPNRTLRYPAAVVTQGTIPAALDAGTAGALEQAERAGDQGRRAIAGQERPALGDVQPVPGANGGRVTRTRETETEPRP